MPSGGMLVMRKVCKKGTTFLKTIVAAGYLKRGSR